MAQAFTSGILGVLTLTLSLLSHATVVQTACTQTQASLTLTLEAVYCDIEDNWPFPEPELYVIAGVGDNEHRSAIVEANDANVATFNVVWDMGCVDYPLSELETPYFLRIAVWEADGGISSSDLGYRGYVRIPKTESGSVTQQRLRDPDTASRTTWMSFRWAWSQIPTKPPTPPPTQSPSNTPTPPTPRAPPTPPPMLTTSPTQTPTSAPSTTTTLPPTATPTKTPHIRIEFDHAISLGDNFTFFWSLSSLEADDDGDNAQLSMTLVCGGCDGFMGVATNDDTAFQHASAIIGVCDESVISIAQYSLRTSRMLIDSSPVQPLTATSCSVVGNVTTLRFSRNVTSTGFNLNAGYIFWMLGMSDQMSMPGTKIGWVQSPTKSPTNSPSHRRPPAPTNYPSQAPTFIGHTSAPPTMTPLVDLQTPSTLTTTTAAHTTANTVSSLSPSIVITTQACANDVDTITQCVQFIYVFDQSCDVLALQCAKTCCRKAIDTTTTTTASAPPRALETTITMRSAGTTTSPLTFPSTSTSTSTSNISPQAFNEPNQQTQQQAHTITIVGGAAAAVIIIIIIIVVVVVCVTARKRRNTSSASQTQSHVPVYEQHKFTNPMFVPQSQSTATTPNNLVNESAYEHPV